MHRYLNSTLLAVLALGFVVNSARADTFDFSYTFNNVGPLGGTITGVLTGTQVGDSLTGYISGVSVQSLSVDGNAVSGTIFNTRDSGGPFGWTPSGGAIVSFDRDQNNFSFQNSDVGNGDWSFNSNFYLIGSLAGPLVGTNASAQSGTPDSHHADDGAGTWTLTRENSANVPDGGSSAALLGLGCLMLVGFRRKFEARISGRNPVR